ncbi:MAG: 4Fe-4S binding protein [Chitinispirillaceae bacterium]|nr:4Fe-4S binding protein [Chitinispirillaceae bacterium]
MSGTNKAGVVARSVLVVAAVVGGSFFSVRLWNEKPERIEAPGALVFNDTMTVAQFGATNNLRNPQLKKLFGLTSRNDLSRRLGDLGYSKKELVFQVKKAAVVRAESESKNWNKIFIKFGAWFVFLAGMLFVLRRKKLTNRARMAYYAFAVVIFGVVLGSDPGPMGTVKDAIALFGTVKVLFPPRMIALAAFLLMVLIANKFICSWGCQAGTLQDLLFRMNRDSRDQPRIGQYRIPFVISNTVRIAFVAFFTVLALAWAYDIIDPIDPFKIFKPQKLSIAGGIFAGALLLASIVVYRPWCHLFCPFGLAGWIIEHVSVFKIVVDYKKCIACGTCVKACPSTVMGCILKRDKAIPDCFACGSCITACPSGAIAFKAGKRSLPPQGKFDKLK